MYWQLYVVIGIVIGVLFAKLVEPRCVGELRAAQDPDDGHTYLYLALNTPVEQVLTRPKVTFKVPRK